LRAGYIGRSWQPGEHCDNVSLLLLLQEGVNHYVEKSARLVGAAAITTAARGDGCV